MKLIGEFVGEAALTLVLLAIGLGAVFLVKWGWSESPAVTIVSVAAALGFIVFGAVSWIGKRDFGRVGSIADITAVVALAAASVVVQYTLPFLNP